MKRCNCTKNRHSWPYVWYKLFPSLRQLMTLIYNEGRRVGHTETKLRVYTESKGDMRWFDNHASVGIIVEEVRGVEEDKV